MKQTEMPPGDKPPIFSSWNTWYILVLLFLVVLITGFCLFTNYFS